MTQMIIDDDCIKGLLVFAPFFMVMSTVESGLSMGLIVFALVIILSIINYLLRHQFTLSQQRLAFVLIINISLILIIRMILEAEAFSFAENIGLFFPLLLINSFLLSVNLSIMTMSSLNSVMSYSIKTGLFILLFFIIMSFLRESLSEITIFSSPAGYFFIFGFIFAIYNYLNKRKHYLE